MPDKEKARFSLRQIFIYITIACVWLAAWKWPLFALLFVFLFVPAMLVFFSLLGDAKTGEFNWEYDPDASGPSQGDDIRPRSG